MQIDYLRSGMKLRASLRDPGHCDMIPSKTAHRVGRFAWRVPDDDLLSHGQSVLSSARHRFTVLFGMGRCGSSGLWSSGIDRESVQGSVCHAQPTDGEEVKSGLDWRKHPDRLAGNAHGYGIKPHGLLVSVSSRHYCPSTPDLSTW